MKGQGLDADRMSCIECPYTHNTGDEERPEGILRSMFGLMWIPEGDFPLQVIHNLLGLFPASSLQSFLPGLYTRRWWSVLGILEKVQKVTWKVMGEG